MAGEHRVYRTKGGAGVRREQRSLVLLTGPEADSARRACESVKVCESVAERARNRWLLHRDGLRQEKSAGVRIREKGGARDEATCSPPTRGSPVKQEAKHLVL